MKHKLTQMTLGSAAAVALAFAALPGQAVAGPEPLPEIVEPTCVVPFTGSVAVGYESTYLFRGVDFGGDAPWAGIDTSWDLGGGPFSLDLGTWYINPTQNPVESDELDVYAFLNFPLWAFDASLGMTWYYFPEAGGETLEFDFILGYSLGNLADLSFLTAYDETIEGWYWELAASKSIPLTDCLSLGLGAGLSYGSDYNFTGSALNHAFATVGLTYALTETAAVDLYLGGNFVFDELEAAGEDDDFHGGVSVSVGF